MVPYRSLYTHIKCLSLINEISSFHNRSIALGPVEEEFLKYFAENPCLSAYQIRPLHNYPQKLWIYKLEHKKERKPMIYKNVNKRVRRLHNLKLIEITKRDLTHGAIYYKLTTGGIYYLIQSPDFSTIIKSILQNYSDNIIFKIFLDPYIKRNTVLQIKATLRISKICSYLHECCKATERAIESINHSLSGHLVEQVFMWQDVPGVDNHRLIDFLKQKFDVDWLEKAEIIKSDDRNTIRISRGNKSIVIKLNDEKDKAILIINRKEYEFTFLSQTFEVLYREQSIKEFEANSLPLSIKSLVANLVFALALEGFAIESDIKALAQDKKFIRILSDNKQKFDDSYQKLLEVSL
jgi:hypothetical protein